ncbi:MAG: hypothetical protein ACP5KP_02645 [Candidatus Micrarchaeia archaeon]
MRLKSLKQKKQKNDRVEVIEKILSDEAQYKEIMNQIVQSLIEKMDFHTLDMLEEKGIIKPQETESYATEYIIMPLTEETWKVVKDIFTRNYSKLVKLDVLVENNKLDLEKEIRDEVGGFFTQILVDKKIDVKDFHPFVLELYGKWDENRPEWGWVTVYGLRKDPTFMGEMLARFVLEGKAAEIDFTNKDFPLKQTVAKHYFGKMWKQKMLFLQLLEILKFDRKISNELIELFVDKTFEVEEKKAFIIKIFVEMAKNRGFELSRILNEQLQKKAKTFVNNIRYKKFHEEFTNSEAMEGIEGFRWSRFTRKDEQGTNKRAKKTKSSEHTAPMKFDVLLERIEKMGVKELEISELGRIMLEVGYSPRKQYAFNAGLIAQQIAKKAIEKIEMAGVKITYKQKLSPEERKLILEMGKEKEEKVIRVEIKKLLIKNGRVLEGYISQPVDEAVKILEGVGVKVVRKSRGRVGPYRRSNKERKSEPSLKSGRYHFARLVSIIKAKGKNEISLQELVKLMEELGYRRTKPLSSTYVFHNTVINKVINLLEKHGINVMYKNKNNSVR